MIYIYTLLDPTTKKIRYVGQTRSPKRRIQSHIDYARNYKGRRKICNWIQSLLKKNMKPILCIIEETTKELWVNREKFWIKYFKDLGFDLCNLTDGGESNYGYKYSNELMEIRRKARLGWIFPSEVREKIAISLSKKVICVDDNIEFNSMKEAIKYSGIPKSSFHRKLCKGELINNKTYKYVETKIK